MQNFIWNAGFCSLYSIITIHNAQSVWLLQWFYNSNIDIASIPIWRQRVSTLQGVFPRNCFAQCLGWLSNNHQSSGIFYPNITLPQIGQNLTTASIRYSLICNNFTKLSNCIGGKFDIFNPFHCLKDILLQDMNTSAVFAEQYRL